MTNEQDIKDTLDNFMESQINAAGDYDVMVERGIPEATAMRMSGYAPEALIGKGESISGAVKKRKGNNGNK